MTCNNWFHHSSHPFLTHRRGRFGLLLDVETGGLHADGHSQVLLHLCFGLVNGHVNAIETRVGTREHFHILVAVDSEAADVAIVALQKAEALHGHTRGACHELQQLRLLLLLETPHNVPEPTHHFMARIVRELARVFRVLDPVVHVDVRQPVQEQLQFYSTSKDEIRDSNKVTTTRMENCNKVDGNKNEKLK